MDIPCQIVSKIDSVEKMTDDVIRLTFVAPDIANTAVPGQFVMVRVGKELDPLLRRPFSIHWVGDNGSLQILFKVVGKGTRLLSSMTKGQSLDIVGPLGKGFKVVEEGKKCIIGGGMGIAPMLFLAQRLLKNNSPDNITILLGARTKSEIEKLESDFIHLGVNVHVATDDGSYGHHGFVTDFLLLQLEKERDFKVLSCGPHPMLKKVATICKENNVECQVSLETMMACGISACLGCAIKKASGENELSYLHVCKDGPVYDMGDIAWE